MRALEAGSIAAGAARCNQAACVRPPRWSSSRVARGSDKAPWLNLSVRVERGAQNPLLELRRQSDRWRRTQPKQDAALHRYHARPWT
jgi:hypothetical protein